MFTSFPHCTSHQLVTDFANSAKKVERMARESGLNRNESGNYFALRVHELMHYRSHTVNTDW